MEPRIFLIIFLSTFKMFVSQDHFPVKYQGLPGICLFCFHGYNNNNNNVVRYIFSFAKTLICGNEPSVLSVIPVGRNNIEG